MRRSGLGTEPVAERVVDLGAKRLAGSASRSIWHAVVGVFYLLPAVFSAIFAISRIDTALDGYAEGPWFGFPEDFARDLVDGPPGSSR